MIVVLAEIVDVEDVVMVDVTVEVAKKVLVFCKLGRAIVTVDVYVVTIMEVDVGFRAVTVDVGSMGMIFSV